MDNTEVKIMAMRLERERLVREHVKEGHILRAMAERPVRAERSDHGGALKLAWHVANGVLQSHWRWAELWRGESEPRAAAAD